MRKSLLLVLILPCVLCLHLPFTTAITKDIQIQTIPESLQDDFSHLFIITNLDHKTGVTDSIAINLTHNITAIIKDNVTITSSQNNSYVINKFTKKTPSYNLPNNTIYLILCAHIYPNITDPNHLNNKGCWNISSTNITSYPPILNLSSVEVQTNTTFHNQTLTNASDQLSSANNTLQNPAFEDNTQSQNSCQELHIQGISQIHPNNQKIEFSFTPFQKEDIITYWIEDLDQNIIKNKITTSSPTKKSFTPKIQVSEKALILYVEKQAPNCAQMRKEQLFVVTKKESQEIQQQQIELKSFKQFSNSIQFDIHAFSTKQNTIEIQIQDKKTIYEQTLTIPQGEHKFSFFIPIECSDASHLTLLLIGLGKHMTKTLTPRACTPSKLPNPISSLYTRAKKYSPSINIYGTITQAGKYTLLVNNNKQIISLKEGQFTLPINPNPHNNTIGLFKAQGESFIGKIITFQLTQDTKESKEEKKVVTKETPQKALASQNNNFTINSTSENALIPIQTSYTYRPSSSQQQTQQAQTNLPFHKNTLFYTTLLLLITFITLSTYFFIKHKQTFKRHLAPIKAVLISFSLRKPFKKANNTPSKRLKSAHYTYKRKPLRMTNYQSTTYGYTKTQQKRYKRTY